MRIFRLLFLLSTTGLYGQNLPTQELDSIFNDYFKSTDPGCAVTVIKNNEMVYENCFGKATIEHNIPITPNTVFEVGSVAKQFTGYGIAILIAQNKLSLEDDIKRFIPELPDYGSKITVDDLIHHKSGIMDQYTLLLYSGYRDGDIITQDDVMHAILNEDQLDFLPGEHYTYSNSNYRLLAEIIERVSGKSYPEFMKDTIFIPLKMSNTQFVDNCDQVIPNKAESYYSDGETYNHYAFNTCTLGSSGLWSTVEDMAKWLQNFEKIKNNDPTLFKLIQQESELGDGTPVHYGFGLEIDTFQSQKLLYHNGVNAGYNSQVYYFPERSLGIVILSNNDNLSFDLANQAASLFLPNSPKDDDAPDDSEESSKIVEHKAPIALSKEELKSFLGNFLLTSGRPISFKMDNGKFIRSIEGAKDAELIAFSKSSFYYKDRPYLEIRFSIDSSNVVNKFDLYVRGNHSQTGNRLAEETKDELKKYCGLYEHDKLNISVSVYLKDNELMVEHFKYGRSKLDFSSSKGLFIGTDFWINQVQFIGDENGGITSLKLLNPPNDRFKGVPLKKKN